MRLPTIRADTGRGRRRGSPRQIIPYISNVPVRLARAASYRPEGRGAPLARPITDRQSGRVFRDFKNHTVSPSPGPPDILSGRQGSFTESVASRRE
jgi:hypothetical protein